MVLKIKTIKMEELKMAMWTSHSVLPETQDKVSAYTVLGKAITIQVSHYDTEDNYIGATNVSFQFGTPEELHKFLDVIDVVRMAEIQSQP
jgi:hypothetical protein